MPETFEAEALVMFNAAQPKPVSNGMPQAGTLAEGDLTNQVLLITSSSMAGKLADRLDLSRRPEFNPALRDAGPWAPAWLIELLPKALAKLMTAGTSRAAMTDLKQADLRAAIVEAVKDRISASLVRGSTTLKITFRSTDAELAADGVNTLAELYLSEQLKAKLHASNSAISFLGPEIERLRTSLARAEQAIEAYRSENGLDEAQPSEQQVSELTTQLVLSRSETAEIEARLRQVERLLASDIDLSQAAKILQSEVLTALNLRAIDLGRQKAELTGNLGPRHPQMLNLQAELAALDESKRLEVRQIAQSLRDEVQVGRSREYALVANIETIKNQLAKYRQAQSELNALQRLASADQALLETYINQSKEIASHQKAQVPDAQIIAIASTPDTAAYPRRPLIFGVVAVAALLLGVLAVFGLEMLDTSLRSAEQVEDLLGLPGLGLVPIIKDRSPANYVLDNQNSPFGGAVRKLRTRMLLTDTATPPKTLLVTSSNPGEGKTSLAISLARMNARSGKRTLLMDCDMRRPRVHEVTEAPNACGLSDVLQRRQSVEEAVIRDQRSGADILPAGSGVFDPEVLLASDAMAELIRKVSTTYNLVILDSPPVLSVTDAVVLSGQVDKTVLLVQWGSTPRNDVLLSVKQLLEAGANMAGVALSQVDVRKHASYGYRDSGHYYKAKYTKYYNTSRAA